MGQFAARIGTSFRATARDGREAGAWVLEHCEPLAKPALDELADADCFLLEFSCRPRGEQGMYCLEADDGFASEFFAVPSGPDRMCVTIN